MNTLHRHYMTLALKLAKRGIYTTSPNPVVGCVIVNHQQIVGQGYHHYAGCAHAEIHALNSAAGKTRGGTAYLTLEPCAHQGKTPPCTDALIQSGIKKIFVACKDPNPLVAGKGIAQLRAAGITVETGLMAEAAITLNEAFFYYIQRKRPFVIAKWAMSLDGKTITSPTDSRHISNLDSERHAHQIRRLADAILIGANTVVADNPKLNIRHIPPHTILRQPKRIVVSATGNMPLDLEIFDTRAQETFVATTDRANASWLHTLAAKGIKILILPKTINGQVCVNALVDALGKMQIMRILVEGGMQLHQSFLNANLVNKIHVYLAPIIIASLKKKQTLLNVSCNLNNRDFYFTADYHPKSRGEHNV